AKLGAERGHWVAGADVAARIEWAAALVAGRPAAEAAGVIYTLVGTSLATEESVPAAFAVLSAAPGDPWRACLLAASLGGGGDMLATSSEVTAGGGFNVMSAAARHGLPVRYAGGHGTGPWGDLIRSALAAEGIALSRPTDQNRDTGFDVALVEPDAERTFVT